MSTLILRLGGALQSWGVSSQYMIRDTAANPTKSGVLGLLAAAEGRRRTDPIEDLVRLRLGVRTEKPGRLLRDYHTMSRTGGDQRLPTASGGRLPVSKSTKVTERFYLEDALFLAFVEGPDATMSGLAQALRHPHFQLFLGRRSCPPAGRILVDCLDVPLDQALTTWPWAVNRPERQRANPVVSLEYVVDDPTGKDRIHDVPLNWHQQNRLFGWRTVRRGFVEIRNPDADQSVSSHDPFQLLG